VVGIDRQRRGVRKGGRRNGLFLGFEGEIEGGLVLWKQQVGINRRRRRGLRHGVPGFRALGALHLAPF
jgi:hypothetical protein